MRKLTALLLASYLSCGPIFSQEWPAQTPPPANPAAPAKQKITIQTPFGPKEVEVEPGQPMPLMPIISSPAPTPAATGNQAAQPAPQPTSAPSSAPTPVPPPAEQTAQPPVTANPAQADPPVNMQLHFDNMEIYGVIKIIADALGLNYIVDPAVKGTVNITTSGTLRRSDLLPILENILRVNGATIVKTGSNFYEIIPANTAPRQVLPVQERGAPPAADDQMVIQILRMKYVAAGEMSKLLTPYLTEGANMIAHETGSILLISERRSNLRKLLEIVDIFDTNAFEGERVRLFPVKDNLAKDLVADLKTIFSAYALSETATAIRFVPIDRMNSILVITPNSAVFPEVEKWVNRLDQPIATAGIRTYVYFVKNAKAVDIQRVIGQLYGSVVQLSGAYQPPAGVIPLASGAAPGGTAAPAPSNAGGTATAIAQTGSVKIIADETNNALVIQTTPQIYPDVERTIIGLDQLRRQVLIDAQIYEVTLDDSLSIGLSAILQNKGTLTPSTTASFVTPATGPPSLAAQTFASIGRSRELLVFLNASENRSRVRTLSAPSVMVSDNMTADFQVGAEVPIPTSSSVTPVQSGGTNLFAQTIQFRPTGVILRVKPQINQSGNVTLEISQEVSQAASNTTSAVVAPVIGKSSVNSTVIIQDGQTIALSGFIRESTEFGRARIPLLGRIPIVGIAFGNTRRSTTRSELIVLITPHVLQTHEDADAATEELKTKLKEVRKLLK